MQPQRPITSTRDPPMGAFASSVQAALAAREQPSELAVWAGNVDARLDTASGTITNLALHLLPTLVSRPFPLWGYGTDVVGLAGAADPTIRFMVYQAVWQGDPTSSPELRLVSGSLSRPLDITGAGDVKVELTEGRVYTLPPGYYFFGVAGTITAGTMTFRQLSPSMLNGVSLTLAAGGLMSPPQIITWPELTVAQVGRLFAAFSPQGYSVG